MKRAWILAVAACTTAPAEQVIGTGSVTLDGADAAMSAWMTPATFSDDAMPDRPTTYIGWSIMFAMNASGTPCSAVREPAWTASITVYSQTRGDTPEAAPITPGTFDVAYFAAPPTASVQVEANGTGVATSGTVTVNEFDTEHIAGGFSATGAPTPTMPNIAFTSAGAFDAKRCDF